MQFITGNEEPSEHPLRHTSEVSSHDCFCEQAYYINVVFIYTRNPINEMLNLVKNILYDDVSIDTK